MRIIYLLTSVRRCGLISHHYAIITILAELTYTNIGENKNRDVRVGSTYKRQLRNFIIQALWTYSRSGNRCSSARHLWTLKRTILFIRNIQIRIYKSINFTGARLLDGILTFFTPVVHHDQTETIRLHCSPDYFRHFENISMTGRMNVIGGTGIYASVSSENIFIIYNVCI